MAFDLEDLTGLEKRFEHIPTTLTTDFDAHKAVVDELVQTARTLLQLVPYGQEAESFVTKLVDAGEEIHTAIDKTHPSGVIVANDKIVQVDPSPGDETGEAPAAVPSTAPEAPVSQPPA